MKTIQIRVKHDLSVECSDTDLGHMGEHNSTCLAITLDQSLSYSTSYMRLNFGNGFTDKITNVTSTVYYNVPQSVMNSPFCLFQITGYTLSSNNPVLIWKSQTIPFKIKRSLKEGYTISQNATGQ